MIPRTGVFLCLMTMSMMISAAEGLISMQSPHSATATMDKLKTVVKDKGLKVFARIDHAGGASAIGESLRPTELLIFGNPQGGTPFMQCAQTVGIDLPLKVLVWEDVEGQVWLSYNDLHYLADRHDVPDCKAVKNIAGALDGIAKTVVSP
ncbi:MAG: hypothetical protein HLUCCX14_00910 [Marinobacter excellens HL-55]|uniref:DUF302 domain-containing protein n=1 Tax=Marinobacter excellens HL-55 TaxID=1305731 RepID=A0A0P7YKD9_9GAMM|nr:MAG: hypothetical protein HLUCCX14_00910 [Marinobacter excellens HL-55]